MRNFITPEQFPVQIADRMGEYDSGNYAAALQKAMDMLDYDALRKEQAEKRERGEFMGIGISSFTEVVGAGPVEGLRHSRHQDVRLRRNPHPPHGQGPGTLRHQVPGAGPRTTYAQIIAEELGLPAK